IADIPAPWKRVVARCLAARPEDRPLSADAVASALQPRRRLLKGTAAAMVAAALVAGAWQWRAGMALTPVRLLVMPLSVDGPRMGSAAGIGLEVADRLTGARRKFTVLSPREAERNHVDTLDKARKSLGATHVLDTRVHASGAVVTANASLIDLQSGRTMRQLQGSYAVNDSQALAKALVATVTEAFHLPGIAAKESVSAAAHPYYVQGIELLRRDNTGNADRALPLFEKAITLDSRSALPYAGLAEAQLEKFIKGDGPSWLDRAESSAAKAKSINADSVPVLLVSGSVRQRHGLYEAAIRDFTRATEIGPNDSEAWRRLASCYERANRPEEAAATYQKAIEAQPNYYPLYLSYGTFYFARGEFGRAEEQYRRVVAVAPGLASGHMNLGLALMQEGRFPEAEGQLLEALRSQPSRPLLGNIGALYYAEERFEDAARFYDRSLAIGAPSAMQYRNLGDADRHLGKPREAAEAYRQARKLAEEDITRNPRRAASHSLLGLVAAFLGDREHAEFEIAQALAIEPENRSVMRDAAIAYEALGQRSKTLAALAKAPRPLLEELNRQPDLKELRYDTSFRNLLSR
ncbi:MAG: tetratricopeptide repeat protein, partial [Acidobacteriota bacterium]|nr:tetratricopeptide repeat protein [Acidobacteriota bacterium]